MRRTNWSCTGASNRIFPKPTLLSLPLDIRLIIWRLLLAIKGAVAPNVRDTFKRIKILDESGVAFVDLQPEQTLAVTRICKALHAETLSVYFGLNHFVFYGTWDMYTYLSMAGVRSSYLKKITFVYKGTHQQLAFGKLSTCTGLHYLDVLVSAETMKGSRKPRRDLFNARGMQAFRAIRGLVDCKITVREVVVLPCRRLNKRQSPRDVICMSLRPGNKGRFREGNINEVEMVLGGEITRPVDSKRVE